jgi:hypothetical protein
MNEISMFKDEHLENKMGKLECIPHWWWNKPLVGI